MDFARGTRAPSFSLRSTDDTRLNLSDLAGKNGTVVVFGCNHCPYVVRALDDMKFEAQRVMSAFAEALGLENSYFDNFIDHPISALRALHYPATKSSVLEKQRRAGAQ